MMPIRGPIQPKLHLVNDGQPAPWLLKERGLMSKRGSEPMIDTIFWYTGLATWGLIATIVVMKSIWS